MLQSFTDVIRYIKLKNTLRIEQMQQEILMTKYDIILSLKIGDFIYLMRSIMAQKYSL